MRIIGLTGGFGSGKTEAASVFESKGFTKITLSQFLEEEIGKRGLLVTRKNLQDIGNEWRERFGPEILAKKALELSDKSDAHKLVIDGIRNVSEIEILRSEGLTLVAIEASEEVRFKRLKDLKRREDLTWDLFRKLNDRDMGVGETESGLQIKACLELADLHIKNEGSLEEFREKLEKIKYE